MSKNIKELFAQLKKDEATKLETKKEFVSFDNPHEIKFKRSNTYKFKLLYFVPDDSTRVTPFINQFSHTFWDDDAVGSKLQKIVCSTSEYLDGNRGFKKCKVCSRLSEFWNEAQDGSKTAKKRYDLFKRKFNGYVLVYVINDPGKKENNGTVKVMRYGKDIQEYLNKEILGIDTNKNDMSYTDAVGYSGFGVSDSYDFIVSVGEKSATLANGEKRTYNKYDCKFSRNKSTVEVDEKAVESMAAEIDFDGKYFVPFDEEKSLKFFNKYITSFEENEDITPNIPPKSKIEKEPEDDGGMVYEPSIQVDKPVEVEVPEEDPEDILSDSELDRILAEI